MAKEEETPVIRQWPKLIRIHRGVRSAIAAVNPERAQEILDAMNDGAQLRGDARRYELEYEGKP
jgi:hypothetical protein